MSVSGGMQGSLLSVCRRVVAGGGVRALYRGFQATLLGDVVGNALGFTFYEAFNRWAAAEAGELELVAGCCVVMLGTEGVPLPCRLIHSRAVPFWIAPSCCWGQKESWG